MTKGAVMSVFDMFDMLDMCYVYTQLGGTNSLQSSMTVSSWHAVSNPFCQYSLQLNIKFPGNETDFVKNVIIEHNM